METGPVERTPIAFAGHSANCRSRSLTPPSSAVDQFPSSRGAVDQGLPVPRLARPDAAALEEKRDHPSAHTATCTVLPFRTS